MKETEISGTERAYAINLNRYDKESKELVSDFLESLADEFHQAGYVDSVQKTNLRVPAKLLRQPRPVRDFGSVSMIITITVFLGTSVGGWAIGKICDDIFSKAKPAFIRLWNCLREKKKPEPEPLFICFRVWYDNNQFYVNIISQISRPEDFNEILRLLPKVERSVYDWRSQNPDSARILTYRIVDGKIPNEPSQSNTIPTE